jgi:hypothetical protein
MIEANDRSPQISADEFTAHSGIRLMRDWLHSVSGRKIHISTTPPYPYHQMAPQPVEEADTHEFATVKYGQGQVAIPLTPSVDHLCTWLPSLLA